MTVGFGPVLFPPPVVGLVSEHRGTGKWSECDEGKRKPYCSGWQLFGLHWGRTGRVSAATVAQRVWGDPRHCWRLALVSKPAGGPPSRNRSLRCIGRLVLSWEKPRQCWLVVQGWSKKLLAQMAEGEEGGPQMSMVRRGVPSQTWLVFGMQKLSSPTTSTITWGVKASRSRQGLPNCRHLLPPKLQVGRGSLCLQWIKALPPHPTPPHRP